MNRFFLWKPGWWILHVLAIGLMAWLGHILRLSGAG
jgi:hypothetical protein